MWNAIALFAVACVALVVAGAVLIWGDAKYAMLFVFFGFLSLIWGFSLARSEQRRDRP